MRRRGVTPIVAVVLLTTITIAGIGTVYTLTNDIIQEQPRRGLNYKLTELNVEQCYNQGSQTHIVVRNGNPKAINVTALGVYVQGAPANVDSFSPELVAPQESFEVVLQNEINREDTVKLVLEGDSIKHRCLDLG